MIDEQTYRELIARGLNYADIGRLHGISRERSRQIAKQYGINEKNCAGGCGKMVGRRFKYCPACAHLAKIARYKKRDAMRFPKAYNDRPAVLQGKEYLESLGIPVELDPYAYRSGPELSVGNIKIKCQQLVESRKMGWQVRLKPNSEIDYWYLTNGNDHAIVPARSITKNVTYIGIYSPLQKYFSREWHHKFAKELIGA